MAHEVDLYDSHYGHLAADPQLEVRRETYGQDLGQASWITADEARRWFDLMQVPRGGRILEVACGSGGVTCAMADYMGAECVGIDINARAIEAARMRAAEQGVSPTVSFQAVDAGQRLPFADESFDAVFCNDSINHIPDRASLFGEWHRLLRPGGRIVCTDPIVVTGQVSNEEIRTRSSIGFFLFTPVGHNERLLREAGFVVREVQDVTDAVASVSRRWQEARSRRREQLVPLEGAEGFDGLQRFLETVSVLAQERRLSRFMYLAEKET